MNAKFLFPYVWRPLAALAILIALVGFSAQIVSAQTNCPALLDDNGSPIAPVQGQWSQGVALYFGNGQPANKTAPAGQGPVYPFKGNYAICVNGANYLVAAKDITVAATTGIGINGTTAGINLVTDLWVDGEITRDGIAAVWVVILLVTILLGGLFSKRLDHIVKHRGTAVRTFMIGVAVVWVADIVHYAIANGTVYKLPNGTEYVATTAAIIISGFVIKSLWKQSGEIRGPTGQAIWGSSIANPTKAPWLSEAMAEAARKYVGEQKGADGKNTYVAKKSQPVPGGFDFPVYAAGTIAERDTTLLTLFILAIWLGFELATGGLMAIASIDIYDAIVLALIGLNLYEQHNESGNNIFRYLLGQALFTAACVVLIPFLAIVAVFVPEIIITLVANKYFQSGGFDAWIGKVIMITLVMQANLGYQLFSLHNPWALWG